MNKTDVSSSSFKRLEEKKAEKQTEKTTDWLCYRAVGRMWVIGTENSYFYPGSQYHSVSVNSKQNYYQAHVSRSVSHGVTLDANKSPPSPEGEGKGTTFYN